MPLLFFFLFLCIGFSQGSSAYAQETTEEAGPYEAQQLAPSPQGSVLTTGQSLLLTGGLSGAAGFMAGRMSSHAKDMGTDAETEAYLKSLHKGGSKMQPSLNRKQHFEQQLRMLTEHGAFPITSQEREAADHFDSLPDDTEEGLLTQETKKESLLEEAKQLVAEAHKQEKKQSQVIAAEVQKQQDSILKRIEQRRLKKIRIPELPLILV